VFRVITVLACNGGGTEGILLQNQKSGHIHRLNPLPIANFRMQGVPLLRDGCFLLSSACLLPPYKVVETNPEME